MGNFKVFLVLMILFGVTRTQLIEGSSPVGDVTQDINENLDNGSGIESTTIIAKEDEPSNLPELPNDLDPVTDSPNNVEEVGNTESSNNDAVTTELSPETTTDQIECVCDCIANGIQVTVGCTTQSSEEKQTEANEIPDTTTSPNNDPSPSTTETTEANSEPETTEANPKPETTTDSINVEATTDNDKPEAETTTQSDEQETETTLPPQPICLTPGVQAHEQDCKQYYDCSLEGSLDGNLHLLTKVCPGKLAFNAELKRCSRDISSCALPIECLVKGAVADSASNSSYYLCEPRLIGLGYRIFHIDCAASEVFYPELGKCFIDFNNIPSEGLPPFAWNQIRDIDIVKAEAKLLKEQDKLKLKVEKEIKKAEEKLQKEIEKAAKKKAKEEEKLNKEKAKQQAEGIACLQEGNIPSAIADNLYFACINKKGKLKAIPMQCSFGATFNPETSSCINSSTGGNVSVSENSEEDD